LSPLTPTPAPTLTLVPFSSVDVYVWRGVAERDVGTQRRSE
jgi:hypothetical protein